MSATIGQPLSQPEAGWKRYNDTDEHFIYVGSKWVHTKEPSGGYFYNWDSSGVTGDKELTEEHSVKFCFEGSKLRIVCQNHTDRSSSIQVRIDGQVVGTYRLDSVAWTVHYTLCYEKTGLEYGLHKVELLNMNNAKSFTFDALDIDASGQLLPYPEEPAEPTNTLAVLLEKGKTVQLKGLMLPQGVTVEDVDWSTEDTAIATIDETGLVTAVDVGVVRITVEAKDKSWSDSVLVKVEEEPEYRLSIFLNEGETCQLTIDEAGEWTSSDPTVSTVSEDGLVTAVMEGIALITVSTEGNEEPENIYVKVEKAA